MTAGRGTVYMNKPAGRRAAMMTGLGVIAVLALGLICSRDLVIQYHMLRLRYEPEYLIRIAGNSEGTLAKTALRKFIQASNDRDALERSPRGAGQYTKISQPKPGLRGQRATLAAGEMKLIELFFFLSNYSGLPVVLDSSNTPLLEKKVIIPSPVPEVDFDLARAILRSHRFMALEDQDSDGERRLRMEVRATP